MGAFPLSLPISKSLLAYKPKKLLVSCTVLKININPLGHGVHQSFTGYHFSLLPLLHDDITELVDVRDLALLHLPFEDAQ